MSDSIFIPKLNETVWDHSTRLDKKYGFQNYDIEIKLAKNNAQSQDDLKGTRAWIGLHPQTLMTPYFEIYQFLKILQEYDISSIVDFGAGYCRVPIIMNKLIPNCHFYGYEIVKERVIEALRVLGGNDIQNWSLSQEDILRADFSFPKGDVYFIYDFSNPQDIARILNQICEYAHRNNVFVIARGNGVRSLIQNKYPELWACHQPLHNEKWSLYSNFTDII